MISAPLLLRSPCSSPPPHPCPYFPMPHTVYAFLPLTSDTGSDATNGLRTSLPDTCINLCTSVLIIGSANRVGSLHEKRVSHILDFFHYLCYANYMGSERFPELGQRIRILRQQKGLTLKNLSRQCSLSVSFLSQIERGLSSFSIPSLRSICHALDVSLPDLLILSDGPGMAFLADPRPPEITKGDNRSYINLSDTSIKYRFLSGGFPSRQFEVLIGEMSPGCRNPTSSHEGEEFGYILEGRIKLTIGDESYDLGSGDSYHLLATTRHGCGTSDEEGAKVLWVQTAKYAKSLSFLRDGSSNAGRPGFSQIKSFQSNGDGNQSHINLSDTSIKYRFLSGGFPSRRFEVLIGEMSPGCRNPTSSHEGEEFGYILEGRIKLTIGEESYNLSPGDSYHLLSATPHVCKANDEEGAKVLWARTATYPKLRTDIRSDCPSRGAARKSVVGSKESV